jgi:hypothetical protein
MASLEHRIHAAQQRLCAIYRLELPLRAGDFLLSQEAAGAWRPGRSPRTGLLAIEDAGTLWLGLYFDPRDAEDPAAILEETSHWIAVVWHAAQERPVSALLLELQADVDRYAIARLARARDPLRHFARLRLRAGLTRAERGRYRAAHVAAFRYCRNLERRFPRATDLPGLLRELRSFYRRAPGQKLTAA